MKYLADLDESKGLVQEVFLSVWEKMDSLPPDIQFRSYLYTAVRNRCLNSIRDKKKTVQFENVDEERLPHENSSTLEIAELEREIELAINSLPEKCREVFELSRYKGLKYSQIAEKLGISIKTVEAQMSKALHVLKARLGEFLTLMVFIFGT